MVNPANQARVARPAAGAEQWCTAHALDELLGVASSQSDATKPVFQHRRVKAGQRLISAGHLFESLFVVNGGFFKTVFIDESGNEQVLGFPMKGDLIGTDGIGSRTHVNEVVALSAADVVVVPFSGLEALGRVHHGLDDLLLRIISQQLVHEQLALTAIGALCAESRLARFLLRTGARMRAMGFSDREFILRMSRQDIGSYLGMKIETVSRTLSTLMRKELIAVNQREVTLLDIDGLEAVHRFGPAREGGEKSARSPATGKPSRPAPDVLRVAATPWAALTSPNDKNRSLAA